ncbi:MAG: amidohydrolase family protein [Anaerolineae bacterium]|nr:amidohydrolase family protein [Anaerolineae bacterium]MDW8071684.1 amidohydrolase family protein [Anaerolineae bacterium]
MASEHLDLVIRNGLLVTASETFPADLLIRAGKIHALGRGIRADGAAEIDARGLLVMPGGIDSHVHLQYPQGRHRVVSSDDWLTGTVAAAHGGTTTVIDFVEARPDQTWMQAFEVRLAEAASQAVIDYAFHMAFNRVDERSLGEVQSVVEAGISSFKIYMAYEGIRLEDDGILRALEQLKVHGALPLVHAENHALIRYLTQRHRAVGHTQVRWHPHVHPAAGEAEATYRILTLAAQLDIPVHIAHVSAAQVLDVMRMFRANGQPVSGEVCPQHLLLTEALYDQPDEVAVRYVMAPPLRSAADNAALWQALQEGLLDCVVTDHCPFTLAQKQGRRRTAEFRRLPDGGVQTMEPEAPWAEHPLAFDQVPGGAPGIETRLPLLYHYGVRTGRLSLTQFVECTSTAVARRFGLYPRKGSLMPGADADLVLFDPGHTVTLSATTLHQNCDYTPFEGWTVTGWPCMVLSRGEIIVRDGQFLGRPGRGEYLKRAPDALAARS